MPDNEVTPGTAADSTAPDIVNVDAGGPKPDDVVKYLKSRIESSKTQRRQFYAEWKRNVELRIGKIATLYTGGVNVEDDTQTEVNPDWSLTKTKTANLFSQVPTVYGLHENKQYAAAVAPFTKQLNYDISEKRANLGVPMEEVLNDVVNAAGIGGAIIEYAARFEPIDVPNMNTDGMQPDQIAQLKASGQLKMIPSQRTVDSKTTATRISPTDLLVPSEFVGSNFDDADFAGRTGRKAWSVAKAEWKLTDQDKQAALAGFDMPLQDTLRSDPEKAGLIETQGVKFDELYYWRYRFDSECKSFKEIWKLIIVHGIEKPVVHEPWKGQKFDPQTKQYVGNCRFPIRILTLTYITDNPIPPSDSAAGRPQVNDLRRSRSQMFQNRERSTPLRWFDVNRIDPTIQNLLMRGVYQGMIPTSGDGSRTIGEIARAAYPQEDLAFDQAAKSDLLQSWQIGPNQVGSEQAGRQTGTEAGIVQKNFATRIGQERARTASFFLGMCEIIAGYNALYSDFPVLTTEERQAMFNAWDNKHILHDLVLKIRPDATIMLDTDTRISRIEKFLNLTAKSGYVNPKPLIIELAELSGVDPAEVVVEPQPKGPEQPNLSYRFTGKDDMVNPMVVALLIKAGQAPSAEDIKQAQALLLEASQLSPVAPATGVPGAPGVPPPTPEGQPGQVPHPDNVQHPEWSLADKIAKRSRDMGSSE